VESLESQVIQGGRPLSKTLPRVVFRELMDAQRKTSKRAAEKRWVSDTGGIDKNLAKAGTQIRGIVGG
jgi:hypothetical protein